MSTPSSLPFRRDTRNVRKRDRSASASAYVSGTPAVVRILNVTAAGHAIDVRFDSAVILVAMPRWGRTDGATPRSATLISPSTLSLFYDVPTPANVTLEIGPGDACVRNNSGGCVQPGVYPVQPQAAANAPAAPASFTPASFTPVTFTADKAA